MSACLSVPPPSLALCVNVLRCVCTETKPLCAGSAGRADPLLPILSMGVWGGGVPRAPVVKLRSDGCVLHSVRESSFMTSDRAVASFFRSCRGLLQRCWNHASGQLCTRLSPAPLLFPSPLTWWPSGPASRLWNVLGKGSRAGWWLERSHAPVCAGSTEGRRSPRSGSGSGCP